MQCSVCGKPKDDSSTIFRCSRCREAPYCSKECQKADWPEHKKTCELWLIDGFVVDRKVQEMERVQGRQFLRTGVKPCVGQRIEITLFMAQARRLDPFRLSGQVVLIKPEPTANWRPMSDPDGGSGPGKGSMELSTILASPDMFGKPVYMSSHFWFTRLSPVLGVPARNAVIRKFGAIHGQEVVCKGRLNFDYDMRRGSEEGPWGDNIPFNGHDVWQFTLRANDSMVNLWTIVHQSFRNLGSNRHPRCWPWSNEEELPYAHDGIDHFTPDGPNGIIVHDCIGPFGCDETDHPHWHGGAA